MALEPGHTILNGKYRILRLIGTGGMARVWLAEELTFGRRQVAIKEPRADLPAQWLEEVRLRYEREVQVCATLEKARVPNIVPSLTAEPYEGELLLVMDYMPGGDLGALLHRHPGGLPVARAVAITLDLLQALEGIHAHEQEIVHRDIKPSNILFDDPHPGAGRAHLADFGLAQLAGKSGRSQLQGGQHPGTAAYMAPEQAASPQPLTPAADLYALGRVLFEMLTGRRHHRVEPGTPAGALRPDVPGWLDGVLARLLHENPWRRPQHAAEVAGHLRAGMEREEEDRARAERHARSAEVARLAAEAQAALRAEDWDGALRLCAKIEELEPGHRQASAWRVEAGEGIQARREAQARERARREQLAGVYAAAQAAVGKQDWAAALQHLDRLAAEAPAYPDAGRLRGQAETGRRAQREAEAEARRREQRLAGLYRKLQERHRQGDWDLVLKLAQQLGAEEPGYRDVADRLAEAQAALRAEARQMRRAEKGLRWREWREAGGLLGPLLRWARQEAGGFFGSLLRRPRLLVALVTLAAVALAAGLVWQWPQGCLVALAAVVGIGLAVAEELYRRRAR